jgi:hypothetical protein
MVNVSAGTRSSARLYLVSIFILAVVGFVAYSIYKKERYDSTRNYTVSWILPTGWREVPHAPADLFRFVDPKTGVVMRGGKVQVVDSINPSADMTSDGMADYYYDRTKQNMPQWSVEKLKDAPAQGVSYGVLKRTTQDKVVLDAFLVKGNTTIVMTMFASGGSVKYVDQDTPVFYSFLGTTALHEKDFGF